MATRAAPDQLPVQNFGNYASSGPGDLVEVRRPLDGRARVRSASARARCAAPRRVRCTIERRVAVRLAIHAHDSFECVAHLVSRDAALLAQPAALERQVRAQLLASDLRDSMDHSVMEAAPAHALVQITAVVDVGVSAQSLFDALRARRDAAPSDTPALPRGMLRLTLSDGFVSRTAYEHARIPALSIDTRLGAKLLLRQPVYESGVWLLDNESVTVLGGAIPELDSVRALASWVCGALGRPEADLFGDCLAPAALPTDANADVVMPNASPAAVRSPSSNDLDDRWDPEVEAAMLAAEAELASARGPESTKHPAATHLPRECTTSEMARPAASSPGPGSMASASPVLPLPASAPSAIASQVAGKAPEAALEAPPAATPPNAPGATPPEAPGATPLARSTLLQRLASETPPTMLPTPCKHRTVLHAAEATTLKIPTRGTPCAIDLVSSDVEHASPECISLSSDSDSAES